MMYLYHLIGGGSGKETYRYMAKSVVEAGSFAPLVKDLLEKRVPLFGGEKPGVWFQCPGGLGPNGTMDLNQLLVLKSERNDIYNSYFNAVVDLTAAGCDVVTYLGMSTQQSHGLLQDSILPLWYAGSKICFDALALYESGPLVDFVHYLNSQRSGSCIVEAEPKFVWRTTDICLATGNQPWNWRKWLHGFHGRHYAILQGGTISGWPEPSVAQAKAMEKLGYVPVLDFWKVNRDTIKDWS